MNQQQKLQDINKYLENYFEKYLIEDINRMRNKNLDFTFPYILLVFAGIDFLGSLEKGIGQKRRNSGSRSKHFINKWMGRINSEYKIKEIQEILYRSARCGVTHSAIVYKEIVTSSNSDTYNQHLLLMEDGIVKEKGRLYLHALQFVDDFRAAYKLFKEEYITDNIEKVYNNKEQMLKEGLKEERFERLVKRLINEGKTFYISNNEARPSASPELEDSTTLSRSSLSNSVSRSEEDGRNSTYTSQP